MEAENNGKSKTQLVVAVSIEQVNAQDSMYLGNAFILNWSHVIKVTPHVSNPCCNHRWMSSYFKSGGTLNLLNKLLC